MAGAERVVVFAAVVSGQFSKTLDAAGRTILFKAGSAGRFDCQKHFGGAKFALGGTHYEEVLMRGQTLSGGHLARSCLYAMVEKLKSVGMQY